jgi:hypothetical protein
MSARLAGASVTHEHFWKTREPTCVTRVAKPFFIHMIHNPLGGHQTRGCTGAPPLGEAEIEAIGHMAALEPTLAWRRGLELRDT